MTKLHRAALLLTGGFGVVLAGVFPWRMVDDVPTETPAHVVGAITAFFATGLGLIAFSRGMRTDSLLERSAILQRFCDDPTLSAGIVGAAAGSGRGRDHPQGLPRSSLEPLGIVREFARSEFLNSREQNSLQAR